MEKFSEIGIKITKNARKSDVNIIHPFIEAEQNRKLSIVGVYDNDEKPIVNGIGKMIPFVDSHYYYGLTPDFSADEVCLALKKGYFKDAIMFEKFIDNHANLFTLPASMSKYARALFAKTLVKMSTMFGYHLVCENKECYNHLCDIVTKVAQRNLDYDLNDSDQSIRLLGQPNEEFLNVLNEQFSIDSHGKLILKTTLKHESLLENLSTNRLSLVQGKGYYSGVLPRVKNFEYSNLDYANAEVISLVIKFERTTFATMDAFDSSYIKHHRLLKEYINLIEEMDAHEDALMHLYFNDLTDSNIEIMKKVNEFLSKSYSAHNLAVSGNIITNDGYLILAKRGAKTIDTNLYYCSVNGQTEILDNKVKFYKQSVYEDLPTIHTDINKRIDFMGELERETEAELNIFCPPNHWKLKGVSFLAIMNSDSKTAERRRFHFNILGECNTEHTLSHVIEVQKTATENFENGKIIGVRITKHKNNFARIVSSIKRTCIWLIKSKDFVTSIFSLAIFAMGFNDLQKSEFTAKSLSSIISVIFTILSLIVLIKNMILAFIRYIKNKSTHYKLFIIGHCDEFYSKVHIAFQHQNIYLHPIADVMLYEYIRF